MLLVATVWLASERPAHAYLDPGAGSVAAQVAIAGVAGALFGVRKWVAVWIGRLRRVRVDAPVPRD